MVLITNFLIICFINFIYISYKINTANSKLPQIIDYWDYLQRFYWSDSVINLGVSFIIYPIFSFIILILISILTFYISKFYYSKFLTFKIPKIKFSKYIQVFQNYNLLGFNFNRKYFTYFNN